MFRLQFRKPHTEHFAVREAETRFKSGNALIRLSDHKIISIDRIPVETESFVDLVFFLSAKPTYETNIRFIRK